MNRFLDIHDVRALLFVGILFSAPLAAFAGEVHEIGLQNGVSVPLYRYRAAGEVVVLWLPPYRGVLPPMHDAARAMADAGIEVWIADLHAGYFVDFGRSSLEAFPDADIAHLIDAVARESGRQVVVMGGNRAAGTALRGIRALQRSALPMSVRGAILLSPALYESPPAPGRPAAWLPIAGATNVPVFIVQPRVSTGAWRAAETAEVLREGGSTVFLKELDGVQGGYLMRPDADLTARDLEQRAATPSLLASAIALLNRLPPPLAAAPMPDEGSTPPEPGPGLRYGLKPVGGSPPSMLKLPTFAGGETSLEETLGAVTIVSFWASWCAPCIEELPSLARLHQDFAPRGLRVVAVNVGEDADTIAPVVDEFAMHEYVLLSDHDGEHMKRWHVYGFPTNFILGADGTLEFGSFGAVAWDDPEVRRRLESLFRAAGRDAANNE